MLIFLEISLIEYLKYCGIGAQTIATDTTEEGNGYRCNKCSMTRIFQKDLLTHVSSHYESEKKSVIEIRAKLNLTLAPLLSCHSCGMVFTSQLRFLLHYVLHQKDFLSYSSSKDDLGDLTMQGDAVGQTNYAEIPPPLFLDLSEEDQEIYFDSPSYRQLNYLANNGSLGELHNAVFRVTNPLFFICYCNPPERTQTTHDHVFDAHTGGASFTEPPPMSPNAQSLLILPDYSRFLSPFLPAKSNCSVWYFDPNFSFYDNFTTSLRFITLSLDFSSYKIVLYEITPPLLGQVLNTEESNSYLTIILNIIQTVSEQIPVLSVPILGIPDFMHTIFAKPEFERVAELDLVHSFYTKLKMFLMIKNIPFLDMTCLIPKIPSKYVPNQVESVLESRPIFLKNGRLSYNARLMANQRLQLAIESLLRVLCVLQNTLTAAVR